MNAGLEKVTVRTGVRSGIYKILAVQGKPSISRFGITFCIDSIDTFYYVGLDTYFVLVFTSKGINFGIFSYDAYHYLRLFPLLLSRNGACNG